MFDMFDKSAMLFTIPALVGTAVFLMKLGLMTIGGDAGDLDIDLDTDVDVDLSGDAEDSTHAFNLLSLQAIAAFMMGFGWGGLGGMIGMEWSLTASLLVGAGLGAAMVWLLGLLMKAMYDLQSSGNVDIRDAIGGHGVIYVGIPDRGDGSGQVRIVIRDRDRIYNAVSDGPAIASRTRVRVTNVNDDNTLTVTPL
jgi:hypothetical protein